MTNRTVPEFPTMTALIGTELFFGDQNGINANGTPNLILTYVQANINISQSQVTNLLTDLAAKADNSAVVHNTGNETIGGDKLATGNWTFNNTIDGDISGNAATASVASAVVTSGVTNDMLAGGIEASKLILTDIVLAQSQIIGLTSDLNAKLNLSGGTLTGNLILNGDATLPLQAVTFQQLESVSAGLSPKASCYAGTTANLSATYNNGASGVGATLTSLINGAFAVDGVSPPLNSRILVKDQTLAAQNGIYTLTTIGDISTPYVLTRATDYDQSSEIAGGNYTICQQGTVNASNLFIMTQSSPVTVGTTAIIWTAFNSAANIIAGAGLAKSGNTLSVDYDTANITLTGNKITTIQSIASGAAPVFSGVNFTGLPVAALTTAISGVLKGNSSGVIAAVAGTDYEVPLTFSTGLTRTSNTVTVNTSQNIATLSNLTTNGFVKTSAGTGLLVTDTSTYALAGANTDITSIALNQTGLVVKGGSSNALTIKPNETLSAGRTFNLIMGDATRTLTMAGDATISGTNTGDQTNISGNAATATALQTARSIYGNNFNGSSDLAQIIASAYGGTGNGFTKFSGATVSEKTYTLPNASCNVLTDNATVTAAQGGTGQSAYTLGDTLYASGSTALSILNGNTTTTRNFLRQVGNGSVSAAPAWDTVTKTDVGLGSVENTALSTWAGSTSITTLGTIATGTWSATAIALSKGGSNANLTASNGGIVYSTSTALAILAGTATAGKLLQSGATAAPTWSTSTYPAGSVTAGKIIRSDGTNFLASTATFADTYTASNLLYSNTANTVTGLATANNGALVTDGSGVPSISSTLPTAVQGNITSLGTIVSFVGGEGATIGPTSVNKANRGLTFSESRNNAWVVNNDMTDSERQSTVYNASDNTNNYCAYTWRTGTQTLDQKFVKTGSGTTSLYWTFFNGGSATDYYLFQNNGRASVFDRLRIGDLSEATVPLDVINSVSTSFSSYGYLTSSGTTGSNGSSGSVSVSAKFGARVTCGGEIDVLSDMREKDLVERPKNELLLNAICGLQPVHFTWKDTAKNPAVVLGFFAQEVAQVFPEAVTVTPGVINGEFVDDLHNLNYNQIIVGCAGAIKALRDEINLLRGQLCITG